jgi:hypothetical protein
MAWTSGIVVKLASVAMVDESVCGVCCVCVCVKSGVGRHAQLQVRRRPGELQ